MKKRILLAMDLDGTAVRDDYSMCQTSIDAIKQAQSRGHVICFVSGRRDVDMLSLGEEQWCVDYHILNNGGKIIRCKDRKVMVNKTIDEESSKQVLEYAFANDLQIHVCDGMTWQISKISQGTLNYAKTLGVTPQIVHNLDEVKYQNLEGLMATGDLEPIAKYIDEHDLNLYYIHSEPGTIDIMAKGVSKWNGIQELAYIENIDLENVIAVGNYYNDMDMLQRAGIGIAVNNSVDEVKQIADYVTKEDNNHDAIKEIVDMFLKEDCHE